MNDKNISLRLPNVDYLDVAAEAEATGRTVSQVIRERITTPATRLADASGGAYTVDGIAQRLHFADLEADRGPAFGESPVLDWLGKAETLLQFLKQNPDALSGGARVANLMSTTPQEVTAHMRGATE